MGLFGPPDITKLEARRDLQGLTKALAYPRQPQVRMDAAQALARIVNPQTQSEDCEWVVKSLCTALNDPEKVVRAAALESLAVIAQSTRHQEAIRALTTHLEVAEFSPVCEKTLHEIGARAAEPLVALFESTNSPQAARMTALRVLSAVDHSLALKKCIRAISEMDFGLEHQVYAFLEDEPNLYQDAGGVYITSRLESIFQSDSRSPETRLHALTLLHKLNPALAAQVCFNRLNSDEFNLEPAIYQTFAAIGKPQHTQIIFNQLMEKLVKEINDGYLLSNLTRMKQLIQILLILGGPQAEINIVPRGGGWNDRFIAALDELERLGWQPGKNETAAYYWIFKKEYAKCASIGQAALGPLLRTVGVDRDKKIEVLKGFGFSAVEFLARAKEWNVDIYSAFDALFQIDPLGADAALKDAGLETTWLLTSFPRPWAIPILLDSLAKIEDDEKWAKNIREALEILLEKFALEIPTSDLHNLSCIRDVFYVGAQTERGDERVVDVRFGNIRALAQQELARRGMDGSAPLAAP